MKSSSLLSTFLLAGLSLLFTSYSSGQDWPGWRGTNQDGKVSGFKVPFTWPGKLVQVWQKSVGTGDASPVMVNNKIFLHVRQDVNEVLLCLDAANGNEVWHEVVNKAPEVKGPAVSHPGPRSTPAIANGKIVSLGIGGFLSCHDATTGKLVWKNEAYTSEVPAFYMAMSPLVYDNTCIVHLGGHEHGTILALDLATGQEKWKIQGEPATYSSPVKVKLDKNILVIQSETDQLGVSMEGQLLWKIATPAIRMFYNSQTPLFDGQNTIISGEGTGTKCFSIKKEGDKYVSSQVWDNSALGVAFNTPVIKDGFLYGNESKSGSLYCLNAQTGVKCWTDSIKYNRFASMLDLGEVMVSLPANGYLIVFKPLSTSYVQLAKYKVSEKQVYAHPIIAGKRIYVKDEDTLTCWEIN
jgi:outer membrane protein assembly factor BamB